MDTADGTARSVVISDTRGVTRIHARILFMNILPVHALVVLWFLSVTGTIVDFFTNENLLFCYGILRPLILFYIYVYIYAYIYTYIHIYIFIYKSLAVLNLCRKHLRCVLCVCVLGGVLVWFWMGTPSTTCWFEMLHRVKKKGVLHILTNLGSKYDISHVLLQYREWNYIIFPETWKRGQNSGTYVVTPNPPPPPPRYTFYVRGHTSVYRYRHWYTFSTEWNLIWHKPRYCAQTAQNCVLSQNWTPLTKKCNFSAVRIITTEEWLILFKAKKYPFAYTYMKKQTIWNDMNRTKTAFLPALPNLTHVFPVSVMP